MDDIKRLREDIDKIDDDLVKLYLKRMELSRSIGEIKRVKNSAVSDPAREREIISRLTAMTDDDQLKGYISRLYGDVFCMSKAYQGCSGDRSQLRMDIESALKGDRHFPVSAKVACQGVDGAYSKVAADKLFEVADVTFFKTFDGVFTAVEKGLCRYGVLPIENSNTGSISQVYDLMRKHRFYIVGSVRVHIKHTLAAKRGTELKDVKVVYSHEQGLGQCAEYLKKLGVETRVVENTAVAARMVSESDEVGIAAICSSSAAEIYGLNVLKADVQDNPENYTRFICVSKRLEIFALSDKISIMLNAAHSPGSLYRLLGDFSALGLNLTKLESRPVGGSDFEFMFYFDFEANIEDVRVLDLLSRLTEANSSFVFLGSYKEKL